MTGREGPDAGGGATPPANCFGERGMHCRRDHPEHQAIAAGLFGIAAAEDAVLHPTWPAFGGAAIKAGC